MSDLDPLPSTPFTCLDRLLPCGASHCAMRQMISHNGSSVAVSWSTLSMQSWRR